MSPPSPNVYDPVNALALCRASADAYHFTPAGTVIDCLGTETRAVISQAGPGEIIVAFRGTEDFRNWITDLDAAPHNFRPDQHASKVHAGFENAWLSIEPELFKAIRATGAKKIWLTGHSLGGALAVLAAADWFGGPFSAFLGGILLQGIYTFGQPRVGNGSFVTAYDDSLKSKTFRVINAEDIVPHVPWLCSLYRHAGHEVRYEQPGQPLIDESLLGYLIEDICVMIAASRKLTAIEEWIGDHFINKYLKLFNSPVGQRCPSAPNPAEQQIGPANMPL